jgi:hypothetical protein
VGPTLGGVGGAYPVDSGVVQDFPTKFVCRGRARGKKFSEGSGICVAVPLHHAAGAAFVSQRTAKQVDKLCQKFQLGLDCGGRRRASTK